MTEEAGGTAALCEFELQILRESAELQPARKWGAAIGAAIEVLQGNGYLDNGTVTRKGWKALAEDAFARAESVESALKSESTIAANYRAAYLRLKNGLEEHLEDRVQAVFEARLEQEKRGQAGILHVQSLQRELDTLDSVREFLRKVGDYNG